MGGSTWIVRLVPAYLLAITFGAGRPRRLGGGDADINTRALLMFLRFRRGRWKRMKV